MADELLKIMEPTLQGLSYWVGYRKQIYPHYELTEGALVAEAQLLISTRLDKDQKLVCEYLYKKIYDVSFNLRADMVIKENDSVNTVIEVKRYSSVRHSIVEDIRKLYWVKDEKPEIRCFLLLVSQQKLPKEFVDKNGLAKRGIFKVAEIRVRVIRNCKSSASFKVKAIGSANYCTLIEVFEDKD